MIYIYIYTYFIEIWIIWWLKCVNIYLLEKRESKLVKTKLHHSPSTLYWMRSTSFRILEFPSRFPLFSPMNSPAKSRIYCNHTFDKSSFINMLLLLLFFFFFFFFFFFLKPSTWIHLRLKLCRNSQTRSGGLRPKLCRNSQTRSGSSLQCCHVRQWGIMPLTGSKRRPCDARTPCFLFSLCLF